MPDSTQIETFMGGFVLVAIPLCLIGFLVAFIYSPMHGIWIAVAAGASSLLSNGEVAYQDGESDTSGR